MTCVVRHALFIEIDIEGDKCMVKYFIPKVCNYVMVNELNGITPVKNGDDYAVGQFEVYTENLASEIVNLILNVPTDEHMFIEGGIKYGQY